MATTSTATLIGKVDAGEGLFHGYFTIVMDTTDASGLMTLDLTDHFSQVAGVAVMGSTACTGYVVDTQFAGLGTAATATNVKLGIYEAGADAGPLDALASTDMSSVITGLVVHVIGKRAI